MVGGVADQDPPGAPGESADRADGQSVADQDPLLTMRGIVKVFPGVRALDGVDLTVRAGEVHCLLGQNGAGKSTLIKILSGAYRPDEGEIAWEGEPITLPSPLAANKLGIATIYQELDLVDGLTVAENIFLGHELVTIGFSDRSAMGERSSELLAGLGHPEIRPGIEVRRLSTAQKQIVSIARALSHEVRLLIMDEPSAVLDPEEVDSLFSPGRSAQGHRGGHRVHLSSTRGDPRIGDRISVLKDGRTVGSDLPVATTGTPALIKMMTGRSIEYIFPQRPGVPPDAAEILAVEALSRSGEFSDVSFSVRPRRDRRTCRTCRIGPIRDPGDHLRRQAVADRGRQGRRGDAPPRLGDRGGARGNRAVSGGAQGPGVAPHRTRVPQRDAGQPPAVRPPGLAAVLGRDPCRQNRTRDRTTRPGTGDPIGP